MLQDMMLKYSIEQEDLREPTAKKFEGVGRVWYSDAFTADWADRLLVVIARGHQCEVVRDRYDQENSKDYGGRNKTRFAIIGEKHLVFATRHIHKALVEILLSVEKLYYQLHCDELEVELLKAGVSMTLIKLRKPTHTEYGRSFFEGVVQKIAERMREKKEELAQKHSTALISLENRADEAKRKLYPSLTVHRQRSYGPAYQPAFSQGQEVGGKMKLRDEVRNSTTKVKRIG